jgi:hypothetical protein
MKSRRFSPLAARWLGATALVSILALAPVALTIQGPIDSTAWAKGGGGGGNGGGDRGGGDKGGGDRADRGVPGKDVGRGNDVASRGRDFDGGRGNAFGHDRGNFGRDVSSRARDLDNGRSGAGSAFGRDTASRAQDLSRRDSDRRDGRDVGRNLADRRDGDRRDGRSFADRRDGDRRDFADRRDGRGGKNSLGNLNAAHASATARANASPNSMVGRIATYESEMRAALAIEDRAARNAAIVAAREHLAQAANKPLTERNIARVDSLLGIQGAPSRLGAERTRDFDRRDFSRVSFDDRRDGRRDVFGDLSRRDRDFVRDLFGEHRHDRRDGFGTGIGRGIGFGSVPVDPARIEARATALDARADRRAAEIRATADRIAAGIIARSDARAADIRARAATAEDPAKFEARAAAVQARGNAIAAAIVSRADRRADLLTERIDNRVETLQAIAAYDRAVIAALEIDNVAARNAAIATARADLRSAIDRPLSGRAIDRLDDRLGLEGTPSARTSVAVVN